MSYKYLDTYIVLKTVGWGRFSKVKAVQCPETQKFYAAKIFVNDFPESFVNNEAGIMGNLSGPGVIRIIRTNSNGIYVKSDGVQHRCSYILMELCVNGDLFDLTVGKSRLSIQLIQVIFHQILSAVQLCHSQNVFHRDLKPENILFDQDFEVKLSDFGTAVSVGQEICERVLPGKFTPPEVNRPQFRGDLGDIFSLGCILFYLVSSNPPFNSADASDLLYRLFVQDPASFWAKHTKGKRSDAEYFTPEFKDLIQKMMNHSPELRPSIVEIRQHPWFSNNSFDLEGLKTEIVQRRKEALEELKSRKDARTSKTNRPSDHRSSDNIDSLSLSFNETNCKKYINECYLNKFTQIRSWLSANTLLCEIQSFFIKKSGFNIENNEFCQVKVNFVTEVESLDIKVAVYEMDEFNMVNFKLLKGSNYELVNIVKDFMIELEKYNY